MEVRPIFEWLDQTVLAEAIRSSQWAVPTLGTIHMIALAAFLGPLLLSSVRLWRGSDSLAGDDSRALDAPATDEGVDPSLARSTSLLFRWGLSGVLLSGLVLLCGEALYCFHNPAFRWKMIFFVPALLLSIALQRYSERRSRLLGKSWPLRAAIVFTLLLWAAVTFAGRFIAFV